MNHITLSPPFAMWPFPLSSRDGGYFPISWVCAGLVTHFYQKNASEVTFWDFWGLYLSDLAAATVILMKCICCHVKGLIYLPEKERLCKEADSSRQLPDMWTRPSEGASHQPTCQLTTNTKVSLADTTWSRDKPFQLSPTKLPAQRIARGKHNIIHA